LPPPARTSPGSFFCSASLSRLSVFDANVACAIGAHRERGADLGGRLLAPDRGHGHLAAVLLAQAERLLDGDLVEGVHLVVDPVGDDPGAVGLHLDLRLGVLHPLCGHQYLEGHGRT